MLRRTCDLPAKGVGVPRTLRSVLVPLLSVLAVATVTVASSVQAVKSVITLTATALYMGGTQHSLSIPGDTPAYIDFYINWAESSYVGPSGLCTGGSPGCTPVAVSTPEDFWPVTGLKSMRFDNSVAIGIDNLSACLRGAPCTVTDPPYTATGTRQLSDTSYTVFGYSQSGTIASAIKSDLIAHPPAGTVNFVFESNPNRPNGGVLERFVGVQIPILDVTFNGATVTNSPQPTPLTTVDIVHQYDPVGDFPLNPLNLFALANALLGFVYEHPEGGTGTAELQGQYQDTTYYLVPTETLPLVRPLTVVPWLGPLLATVIDPPLRVLVETGYDRTINPGAPTPVRYLYLANPLQAAVNTLKAIPTGWDNGIAYLSGDPTNRPFHTAPPGPYGVGGPPVDAGAVDPYGPPTPLAPAAPVAPAAPRALPAEANEALGQADSAEAVRSEAVRSEAVRSEAVRSEAPRARAHRDARRTGRAA
ncbi:MAG: PE-PPE domain-containing protein [Mycobacterium sp.]|nr:PE-PPE domain-containing protein [Mycobacterium sp.]